MDDTGQLIDAFLRWWIDPRSIPGFSSRFVTGFSFQTKPAGLVDEDAVWFVEQRMPWSGVEVKKRVIEGDSAIVVLEGEDPVTALRHRVTFRIVVSGRQISSVLESFEDME
ncbi:MAG: hypothetical protein EOO70_01305 [Myxococcaceae bacterium]|nr:MAG: hypothetical protein EOO70_01305 [Myxococcaceae bacterium]